MSQLCCLGMAGGTAQTPDPPAASAPAPAAPAGATFVTLGTSGGPMLRLRQSEPANAVVVGDVRPRRGHYSPANSCQAAAGTGYFSLVPPRKPHGRSGVGAAQPLTAELSASTRAAHHRSARHGSAGAQPGGGLPRGRTGPRHRRRCPEVDAHLHAGGPRAAAQPGRASARVPG